MEWQKYLILGESHWTLLQCRFDNICKLWIFYYGSVPEISLWPNKSMVLTLAYAQSVDWPKVKCCCSKCLWTNSRVKQLQLIVNDCKVAASWLHLINSLTVILELHYRRVPTTLLVGCSTTDPYSKVLKNRWICMFYPKICLLFVKTESLVF